MKEIPDEEDTALIAELLVCVTQHDVEPIAVALLGIWQT